MKKLAWLVPLLLGGGCVTGDDSEGDLDLGETDQAVSSVVVKSVTCSGTDSCIIDLGVTSNDHACFLGGISGKVNSGSTNELNDINIYRDGSATPHYHLQIYTSNHDTIWAEAVCVPIVAASKHVIDWDSTHLPTNITGGTAARRCFLNQIAGFKTMGTFEDQITVSKISASIWQLGAVLHNTGQTWAEATCFDVAADLTNNSWGQGTTGSTTLNVGPTYSGTVACGLNTIAGRYNTNDIGSGQQLWRTSSNWNWTLANFVGGAADCFQ